MPRRAHPREIYAAALGRVPTDVGIRVGGGGEGWGPSWERAAVEADGEQDVEEREGEKERECGVVGLD